MVEIAAAVEDCAFDTGLLRRLGETLANLGGLLGLVALERLRKVEPGRRGERAAGVVVDELSEDAAVRAEDEQARALEIGRASCRERV